MRRREMSKNWRIVLFFYWFYEFTILLNFYSIVIGDPD
jgi:hypothetical protein